MKLWKRAAVAIKDGPSLIAADDILTASVVKATSHDELSIDKENAQFMYRHVLASPSSLKPLISAISSRVKRTRSWAVALKGLMLMHGFFLCKTTVAESIGRLPFDLSSFGEGNSRIMNRSGGFNLFVRAYFAFLDRRSILFHDKNRHRYDEESSVMIRLVIIRKMQIIVDSLIRIKPIGENMEILLINEAMENVISEILEIYGWICRRIAEVLPNVHSKIGKTEADLALKIVAKSMAQGGELVKYFEFCKDLGVSNAQEIPNFVRIPEADVIHLDELVRTAVKEDRREATEIEEGVEIVGEEEEGRETKRVLLLSDFIKLDQNEQPHEQPPEQPPEQPHEQPPEQPPEQPHEQPHEQPPASRVVDIPDLISF